jgi:hypothetical protein
MRGWRSSVAARPTCKSSPWVESLERRSPPREALGRISRCPFLAHLRTLDLSYNAGLGAEGLAALASSPHLSRLVNLNATRTDLGEGGAEPLAAVSGMANLEKLALGRNALGPRTLWRWPGHPT